MKLRIRQEPFQQPRCCASVLPCNQILHSISTFQNGIDVVHGLLARSSAVGGTAGWQTEISNLLRHRWGGPLIQSTNLVSTGPCPATYCAVLDLPACQPTQLSVPCGSFSPDLLHSGPLMIWASRPSKSERGRRGRHGRCMLLTSSSMGREPMDQLSIEKERARPRRSHRLGGRESFNVDHAAKPPRQT